MILAAGSSSTAQSLIGTATAAPTPVSLYATAPVALDGQNVFSVATATGAENQLPANIRAADIEAILGQITGDANGGGRPEYDLKTLRITIRRQGASDVLEATDAEHHTPLSIATVTAVDATAQGQTADDLAAEWQESLQGALANSLAIREPRAQQRNLITAAIALVVVLVISLSMALAIRRLGRRITEVGTEVEEHQDALAEAQASASEKTEEHHRAHTLSILKRTLQPAQKLSALRAIRDLLVWLSLLIWCGGLAWGALLFPQTTPLGHTFARNGLTIASIFIITGILDRALTIVIGRLPFVSELRHFPSSEQRQRQTLRMPTIVQAMNGFKTFILFFLAALSALTQIGIPVGSVVTIGGVAAIAVSLAAQNLIRDVVSGFLVLAEDQFVLGDFVTINGASGIVERLTLRMAQLRDGSGGVVTISHSAATSVVNHSRSWSGVDYAISIDAGADAQNAIALLRSTISSVAGDKAWHSPVSEPIEWIGVDGFSRDGIVIRARIRTGPLQQYALQRELNLHVSDALRKANIPFGAAIASVAPTT